MSLLIRYCGPTKLLPRRFKKCQLSESKNYPWKKVPFSLSLQLGVLGGCPPLLLPQTVMAQPCILLHPVGAHPRELFSPSLAPPQGGTSLQPPKTLYSPSPLTTTTLATSPCWYSALLFIRCPGAEGELLIETPSYICLDAGSEKNFSALNWTAGAPSG